MQETTDHGVPSPDGYICNRTLAPQAQEIPFKSKAPGDLLWDSVFCIGKGGYTNEMSIVRVPN